MSACWIGWPSSRHGAHLHLSERKGVVTAIAQVHPNDSFVAFGVTILSIEERITAAVTIPPSSTTPTLCTVPRIRVMILIDGGELHSVVEGVQAVPWNMSSIIASSPNKHTTCLSNYQLSVNYQTHFSAISLWFLVHTCISTVSSNGEPEVASLIAHAEVAVFSIVIVVAQVLQIDPQLHPGTRGQQVQIAVSCNQNQSFWLFNHSHTYALPIDGCVRMKSLNSRSGF